MWKYQKYPLKIPLLPAKLDKSKKTTCPPVATHEKQTTNSQYSYAFTRYQMTLKMANHYNNVPPPGETEGFISTFLSH